jgi:hypothetical protein
MSRVATDKDQDLLQKKGGNAFPFMIFMDAEGNVLAKHEGSRDAAGFGTTGKKVTAFVELKSKAAKGDKAAKLEYLIAQVELGHLKASEVPAKLKEAGPPTKEQQAKLDGALANAEVTEILEGIQDEAGEKAASKKLYDRVKAGKAPPSGDQVLAGYWSLVLAASEEAKDVATFENALKELKAKFGNLPQAQKFFQEKEAALQKLKAPK